MKTFLKILLSVASLFALFVTFDVVYKFLCQHSKKYISNTDIVCRYDG